MTDARASQLVFLHDLPNIARGEKVRFLGCNVVNDQREGAMFMSHIYASRRSERRARNVFAKVNIDLVRQTASPLDLQIGAWVNVIGYISDETEIIPQAPTSRPRKQRTRSRAPPSTPVKIARVQAIVLWGARDLNLGDYERALEMRQATEGQPGAEET